MNPRVAVASTDGFESQAHDLARRLSLQMTVPDDPRPDFLLHFIEGRLQLQQTGSGAPGPVWVDFVAGKAAYRRQQGEGRRTPLARAVGFKPGFVPRVIDATAGLGQDALVLATLGCTVTLVEQSPVVHALLEDGLRRAAESPETRAIVSRMSLVHADSAGYLEALPRHERPDAIYLDPMYPHKGRQALSKKGMQALQRLLGQDLQGDSLLRVAQQNAGKRIAVKRPARAEYLGGVKPDFQVQAAKTRFDIYLSSS